MKRNSTTQAEVGSNQQDGEIGRGGDQGRGHEQAARIEPVGEAEYGGGQTADHETGPGRCW